MKTTFVVSSALVFPIFVNLLIGIPMFAMFSYFIFTTVGSPFQPSFYNVWHNILSDYKLDIEWITLSNVNDWNDATMSYTHRAAATLGIMALSSTMGSGIEISFVLEFALHIVNNIGNWQSDLPIENQQILGSVFQSIHASAVELRNLCVNIVNSNWDLVPQDFLAEIHRLIRDIFRGYCAIFNNLSGGWETLNSQLEGDFLQENEQRAMAAAIRSVQSYISMNELQDNRDAIFTNFLSNILNLG